MRRVNGVIAVAVMLVSCGGAAFAACSAPAQSGLALCFPSAGSTVLYPATIEMAVNSGGEPITHLSVYDGNVEVDDQDFIADTLIDYSLLNGTHHITVNAWDAKGKLYQAKTSFTITGFGFGPCAKGSGLVTLCEPSGYVPEGSAPVFAYFASGVKSWSMTLDGTNIASSGQGGLPVTGPLEMDAGVTGAGAHTLVVKAVATTGATSTVTRSFSTFYNLDCSPKGNTCSPGIEFVQPANASEGEAADVGTSFKVQAEVVYNTKPTTKMIVYLDGKNIEQSTGPGITANVTATKGTHYLVILAWDTAGKLYETYGNVNVQ
jgi:hypothetical protein